LKCELELGGHGKLSTGVDELLLLVEELLGAFVNTKDGVISLVDE